MKAAGAGFGLGTNALTLIGPDAEREPPLPSAGEILRGIPAEN